MKKQYPCIDAAKLIMSLFVVAIHTYLFGEALYPTIRLAVPVFFIFTGFLSFTKLNLASGSAGRKTLWDIEKRYLQLYIFWFIVLLPATIDARQYNMYGLRELIGVFFRDLIWGSTFRGSWYLMACMLGVAIVYFLSEKTKNNRVILLSLGAVFYIFATCTSKYSGILGEHPRFSEWYWNLQNLIERPYNNVFISIFYLVIGKMIAEQQFKFVTKEKSLIGFIICYIGLLCEFYLAKRQPWFYYICDCWFMLAPTAVFFVLFVLQLDCKIKHSATMRKMSTIIYCSHFAIIIPVSEVLSVFGITDNNGVFLYSLTLLCAIALSMLILKLEKKDKLKFLKYSH